jgi:hypothetical protein
MSFSFKAIAQTSASDSVGSVQEEYSYNGANTLANDDLATIKASGYFNEFANQLNLGDKIYLLDNAAAKDLVAVTALTPNVTVASILAALPAGSVTLAELSTGIAPSHVVKFAAPHVTVGGGATENIVIAGVLATDRVFVQMQVEGAAPVTVLAALANAGSIDVKFSADPSNDHTISYQILRAAV